MSAGWLRLPDPAHRPPLLFRDGWRVPKAQLLHEAGPILQLALGLVVFTVVGVGLFVHWLVPSMPLAVAFALAAIVSPTDAVAVSAIATRVPLPRRLLHILEGEALLNDATGLVCFRFAVIAAVTGEFSLLSASLAFLWLALALYLALAAVRLAWTLAAMHLRAACRRSRGENAVRPPWRLVLAMSLSGVRGAVTLAGVLTLPLMLPDGRAFPSRDLAIFLAMSVIVLSLLVASLALPRLLLGLRVLPEPGAPAGGSGAQACGQGRIGRDRGRAAGSDRRQGRCRHRGCGRQPRENLQSIRALIARA